MGGSGIVRRRRDLKPAIGPLTNVMGEPVTADPIEPDFPRADGVVDTRSADEGFPLSFPALSTRRSYQQTFGDQHNLGPTVTT